MRETVPKSQVEISISIDSLRKLPEGAVYEKSSGQARVSVSARGDEVEVTATCDSLEREVEYYAELYFSSLHELEDMRTKAIEEMQTKDCRHTPLLTTILALAAGIIAGSTATLIIKTIRNG